MDHRQDISNFTIWWLPPEGRGSIALRKDEWNTSSENCRISSSTSAATVLLSTTERVPQRDTQIENKKVIKNRCMTSSRAVLVTLFHYHQANSGSKAKTQQHGHRVRNIVVSQPQKFLYDKSWEPDFFENKFCLWALLHAPPSIK